jgi:hypothetical protein
MQHLRAWTSPLEQRQCVDPTGIARTEADSETDSFAWRLRSQCLRYAHSCRSCKYPLPREYRLWGSPLTRLSFYDAAAYLDPIPLFYEPFAIVALFYFFVTTVTPTANLREQFYSELERQHFGRSKGRPKHGGGSLAWFHVCVHTLFLICGILRHGQLRH